MCEATLLCLRNNPKKITKWLEFPSTCVWMCVWSIFPSSQCSFLSHSFTHDYFSCSFCCSCFTSSSSPPRQLEIKKMCMNRANNKAKIVDMSYFLPLFAGWERRSFALNLLNAQERAAGNHTTAMIWKALVRVSREIISSKVKFEELISRRHIVSLCELSPNFHKWYRNWNRERNGITVIFLDPSPIHPQQSQSSITTEDGGSSSRGGFQPQKHTLMMMMTI